jgi:hypothetical protein
MMRAASTSPHLTRSSMRNFHASVAVFSCWLIASFNQQLIAKVMRARKVARHTSLNPLRLPL